MVIVVIGKENEIQNPKDLISSYPALVFNAQTKELLLFEDEQSEPQGFFSTLDEKIAQELFKINLLFNNSHGIVEYGVVEDGVLGYDSLPVSEVIAKDLDAIKQDFVKKFMGNN